MIQHSKFSTGGFVLHKMMVNGKKHSAWFDAAGKLLSAERYSRCGRHTACVPLERHRNVAAELAKVGARYV